MAKNIIFAHPGQYVDSLTEFYGGAKDVPDENKTKKFSENVPTKISKDDLSPDSGISVIKVHEKKNKRHNSKSTGTSVTDENKKAKKNISENEPTVLAEKIYKVTRENEIVLYNQGKTIYTKPTVSEKNVQSSLSAVKKEKSSRVKCGVCTKSFVNSSALKNHCEIVHRPNETLECHRCGECFFRKQRLV